jgi:DNA invertase Pin-like site-specific DNA recombinase
VLAGLSLFGYGGRVTVIPNRFAIHILAAVNEYGAKVISERTRAAMAAGASPPQGHREKAKARALDFGGSSR